MVSLHGPIDRPRHVFYVNERTPGGAIAQDGDALGHERAGDKIVQHKIQSQPITHPGRRRKTEARYGGRFQKQAMQDLVLYLPSIWHMPLGD